MKNLVRIVPLVAVLFGSVAVVSAEETLPLVEVHHSPGVDLVGLVQYQEGWGSSAPGLAAYVDQRLGRADSLVLLQQVQATIDSGGTSRVAMLNSGFFLDQPEGEADRLKAADETYQGQLDRAFLSNLFQPGNPGWVQFSTSKAVQAVMDRAQANYPAVERYLGNFLRLKTEIGFLENLFSYRFDRYVVVPSFFFLPFSGSGLAIQKGSETRSYFVFGVRSDLEEGTEPGLRTSGFTKTSDLAALAVHEFAHTFYGQTLRNPQSQRILALGERFGTQFGSSFESQGYRSSNFEGIFEESFVRGLEVLFLEEFGTPGEADQLLRYEENLGFLRIDAFLRGIKKSRTNHDFDHVVEFIERELES